MTKRLAFLTTPWVIASTKAWWLKEETIGGTDTCMALVIAGIPGNGWTLFVVLGRDMGLFRRPFEPRTHMVARELAIAFSVIKTLPT